MELGNHAVKQTYIQLLADTLRKKIQILHKLIELTVKQENIITCEKFIDDDFLENISLKEEQVQALVRLENGFEQLYESVRQELITEKSKYLLQIKEMQEQIKVITDLGVELQAMEQRNKSKIEEIKQQE